MIDRWDCVGGAGVGCVVAAVSAVYWPAGLFVFGLGLCVLYYLRETR